MAIDTINIGSAPNDGTGDPLRTAFNKTNTNFLNITEDGGDEITVLNPTTSTDTTLNVALQDVFDAGGGGAVSSVNGQTGAVSIDLESVLTEGNESDLGEAVQSLIIKGGDIYRDLVGDEMGIASYNDKTVGFAFEGGGFVLKQLYSATDFTMPPVDGVLESTFTVIGTVLPSITANLNVKYATIVDTTFIDPTPVSGKGYIVYVVSGTTTINSVTYTSGNLVYRFYNGSSWVSTLINASGSVSDGDKGDITVSSSGTVWTIDNGAVSLAKTSGVQAELVSGTNIKTINGTSVLGSGDISIGGVGATQNARATRLELTNNISLPISPTGSVTVIDFDNSIFNVDPTVFTNNGAGTVTCTLAGNYLVTTSIVLESPLASAITKSELGIRKNGSTVVCATTDDTPIALGNNIRSLTTSTIINLASNDTLQAVVNLFGASATGQALRLPALFGTTATQVSNISIERLEVSEFDVDSTIIDGSANAVSGNAVFDGLALKEEVFFKSTTTSTAVTGTTSNTILVSALIPANTFTTGSDFRVSCNIQRVGGNANATFRMYVNTTNSLSGATQLGTFTNGATNLFNPFARTFPCRATNLVGCSNPASNLLNDTSVTQNATYTTASFNFTVDNYIIIAVQPTSALDSFTSELFTIKGNR